MKPETNNAVPPVPLSRLVRDLCGPTRRELIYKQHLEKLKRKHGQARFDMAGKVAGHTPNDIEWWLEVATPNYLKKQYAEILSKAQVETPAAWAGRLQRRFSIFDTHSPKHGRIPFRH
jgi:hypothetical protein